MHIARCVQASPLRQRRRTILSCPYEHQVNSGGERQLSGNQFREPTGRSWPISDRFAPPNLPLSATNPEP
jgi:hypothetical protein